MIKLREYQREAVDKAKLLSGFLNADEMGTGKTIMQLQEIKEVVPSNALVITPKTAIEDVWVNTIEQMFTCPFDPTYPYTGTSTTLVSTEEPRVDFTITNWAQLRLNPDLTTQKWDYVIADEAHFIKNRKTKQTKALKYLVAGHKRELTGTPIVNRPDELWSLLNWLYPREFRAYWKFYNRFCEFELHPRLGFRMYKGAKNEDELRQMIEHFYIRRLKKDVLPELPDKYYQTFHVDLPPRQRRPYEEMKRQALAWVGDHEDQPVPAKIAVSKLLRQRQFAAAYAEVVNGHVQLSEPSVKLDAMMDIIEGGAPIVVFSNFEQMIELASQRLSKKGIEHRVISGKISDPQRKIARNDFQSGRVDVILAVMKTGGISINLQRASTAIFLDRSWSPAENLQAEDRLHRYGQKNAVQIINIEARDTVDQAVEQTLYNKWSMIRAILEGV